MSRHRFFYLLNHARHALARHADRACRDRLGISASQLGVIYAVSESPGMLQRELAIKLTLGESAVTGLVGRMESAGLVERRPSPDDGRVSCLYPTERAAGLRREAKPLLAEFNAALSEGFTAEELDTVARFLSATMETFADPPGSGKGKSAGKAGGERPGKARKTTTSRNTATPATRSGRPRKNRS